jgi:C-terminal processing protease CtpA/Prc
VRVEQGAPFAEHDAELVGVVLALGDDGYHVVATVSGLDDVRPGDVLVAVGGDEVADQALPDVLDLLRGTPGDRKRLTVRRDGETLDVDVPVLRLV